MHRYFAKLIISTVLISSSIGLLNAQGPGCPSVDAGPDISHNCSTACDTLTAIAAQAGATTGYSVSSIPYAPPFPFTGGTQLFLGIDDEFSPLLNLPFDFCFYDVTHTSLVVGTNGVIVFDPALASGYCEWSFTAPIPTPGPPPFGVYNNSINGVYHDMDPSVGFGADINYGVIGSAPCRTFIMNFTNVPHFSCNNITSTQQIVLYETTNTIEVYVQDKPTCFAWNSGNALIGIQNPTGTAGVVPPGRNTGPWSATNEAWRFSPNGIASSYINWYDETGALIDSNASTIVCPSDTSSYIAEANYITCVGDTVSVYDTVTININSGFTVTTGQTDETCFGVCDGSIILTPSGGTPPFSFDLGNGPQLSGQFLNLCSGNYAVTVSDLNTCTGVYNFQIASQQPLNISDSIVPVLCSGDSTGAIFTSLDSAVSPISYAWSTGDTSQNLTNLTNGTYFLTVTDSSNCPVADSFVVSELTQMVLSSIAVPTPCAGVSLGSIDLSLVGGTPPYSFSWTGGDTSEDIDSLASGIYQVVVTDSNGCTASISDTILIADTITLSSVSTNAACFGALDGAVDLTVFGGTLPYGFTWSNGILVEDLVNVGAGIYSVTVVDPNGCNATLIDTVDAPQQALSVSHSTSNVLCHGDSTGAIDLTVSGGSLPYTFVWSNLAATEDLINIPAGTYMVTITDTNNCIILDTAVISESVALVLVMDSTDEYCTDQDGSASVSVIGGVGPYTFMWDDGQQTSIAGNLGTGSYTVTVTDALGCVAIDSISVNVSGLPVATSTSTPASCSGFLDGLIDISVGGGLVPYFYIWSNGTTTEDLTNVVAGSYTVTISDALGCSITHSNTITEPIALNPSIVPTLISCNGSNDGAIDLNVSGGTQPYNYTWSNGANTEDLTNLGPGQYDVTITDANMCTFGAGATITEPTAIAVSDSIIAARCQLPIGEIYLTASGGTVPYSYQWSDGSATQNITGIFSGNYLVTITDAHGCTLEGNYLIDDSPVLVVEAGPDDTIQIGTSTVLIPVFSVPADVTTWSWSPDVDLSCLDTCNPVANPFFTTTYILSVQDIYGCSYSDEITVVVISNPVVYIPNVFTPDGDGINDLFFVQGQEIADIKLVVYDRWGQKLFQGNELSEAWDGTYKGTKLSPDVFVYYAEVTFLTGKEEFYRGSITIVK